MSCSSSRTRPRALAPRTASCMRLRQRMSVLLPQPEGPMMAVMRRGAMLSETSSIAFRSPYQAFNSRTSSLGPASGSSAGGGGAGADSPTEMELRNDKGPTRASVREGTHSPSDDPARERAEHADQGDKHQRGAPGLGMPIRVRRAGVLVELDWKGGHRLQQVQVEELIAERGQQQWRGFTPCPRQREHHAGDHTSARGREDHTQDRLPAWDTQREAGFAKRVGHQTQRFLDGASNDRNHDDGQRDTPRQTVVLADDVAHQPRPDEEDDDDRGQTGDQVDAEADHVCQAAAPELRQVDRGSHAKRK